MTAQAQLFTDPLFQARTPDERFAEKVAPIGDLIHDCDPGFGLYWHGLSKETGLSAEFLQDHQEAIATATGIDTNDLGFFKPDAPRDFVGEAWDIVLSGDFDGDPADLPMM